MSVAKIVDACGIEWNIRNLTLAKIRTAVPEYRGFIVLTCGREKMKSRGHKKGKISSITTFT